MRKAIFANGEYYHIFNRGVDKRTVFEDGYDMERFFQSMNEFNAIDPIGSIYENSFLKNNDQLGSRTSKSGEKLVSFVSYCLNANHYHFILKQETDKGIEKFMHRVGTGYTKYFNNKYDRSGALFQGGYKAVHVNSNEQLLYLSVYVNLNNEVHQLGSRTSKLPAFKSSWDEYVKSRENKRKDFCGKESILSQFRNKNDYRGFARKTLKSIIRKKENNKAMLLE